MTPRWLQWARRIDAIGQTGLAYNREPYDRERYESLRAIAAEMIAEGSGEEVGRVAGLLGGDSGYATPKVDVRGVVFRDGKLLLVRERSDGLWTLPGGWADVGDSPAEGVVREIREESGFETRATKLLAVLDRDRQGHPNLVHHTYKLLFRCEIVGGAPATSYEILEVGFFAEDEIPDLSLERTLPSQIARAFLHERDRSLPADFD
ncbi:bifunctional nicotinamide mononucleotide adenylyltransferase/ADP-ribose pyrophosphatase [Aquisphaera giovannonii]|uniref:Bifunctional nicotinamide mononucleotide adenylyltransferase/ADP-ribose pyrophosphatase n=1 Tax=Aquisphaera giovannonii TaxID=406548 RepID=A0A5B9W1L7_9BACT|nr:NUDIX hydrolase [Aquisphaera giovannonii]QEH33870.1 bifunctional nicotinamide mononucleotide adenylyltransferase/ADP-ribose pyrophosphatase [Aquisphaera giovannonii]